MIQRNKFEMAAHNLDCTWHRSEERAHYRALMELRDTSTKLVNSLKDLTKELHKLSNGYQSLTLHEKRN